MALEVYEAILIGTAIVWMYFIHNWLWHDAWPSTKREGRSPAEFR